ncbi:MAG: methyltransferase domain-containing protein [Rubrivivax sp.]|nr:methyltransferase domain-containing protein [Rubrivivax sp.]
MSLPSEPRAESAAPQPGRQPETDAVVQRYARRSGLADRYSLLRPEVWQMVQERQRAMIRLLVQQGLTDLPALKVVEVGCGAGGNLLELLRLGFDPAQLTGIELLPERLKQARRCLPAQVTLIEGDASVQAIAPASVDIVLQSTVFSSLLDPAFQQQLADALWSWLKPGGGVLWYDFTVDNPRNPDVRGVPLARVQALFRAARLQHERVTLAPPLARLACGLHPALYGLLNALPLLRTHVLVWAAKPG